MESRSTEMPMKRQQVASASAASPYIPDDLVRRILLRLPSRSVLRCRAVCKAWLRMASDPAFVLDHHRLQPVLPLVSFLRCKDAAAADADPVPGDDCCLETFDLAAGELHPAVRSPDAGGRLRIHGSCDGLLLLLSLVDRFFVCNPATRQWARLPAPLRASWLVGFYRHDPTGEYRALFYRGDWAGGWPSTCNVPPPRGWARVRLATI